MAVELQNHVCTRQNRRELKDARGIFCCFVCDDCEAQKRAKYRRDIFEDPGYIADEDIDGDG